MSVAHALTICGGLFEAGGIGLTVREVVRVEDRAFPERRGRLLRAWRRMRARLSGESRTIHVSGIDSAVAIGGSVSVRVDRGAAHPEDLKARIDRLEKLVDDRDREHRGAVERVEQRIVEVQRELGERVDELVAERSRKDTEDREALADLLALQKAGAVLFIVGASSARLVASSDEAVANANATLAEVRPPCRAPSLPALASRRSFVGCPPPDVPAAASGRVRHHWTDAPGQPFAFVIVCPYRGAEARVRDVDYRLGAITSPGDMRAFMDGSSPTRSSPSRTS